MEPLFDISFVTSNFGTCGVGHYLNLLKSASNVELRTFKKQVLSHAKQNKQRKAFINVQNYTSHEAIVSAINHELLKRSWRYKLFKIILPIRQWLVKVFSGIELKENPDLGPLYCTRTRRSSVWHLSHTELKIIVISFLKLHFKWVITTLIAVAVIYLRLIGKL